MPVDIDFASSFASTAADIAAVLPIVEAEGAAAIPWLDERAINVLESEAEALSFRVARPVIGEGENEVRQEFEVCRDLPDDGAFQALTSAIEGRLNEALAKRRRHRTGTPLRLNDIILQRYPPGCLGITPHRDHIKYTDLVVIVVVAGDGRFCVCTDRQGRDTIEIPAPAGHLILMRAPGFDDRHRRPFHFLDQVTERRYSFGMRQDSTL
jgi:hypothetical protein